MSVTVPQPPAPGAPGAGRRTSAAGSSASWSLTDRLGLALAWFLGLLFCAITAAIVIFLLVQGIRYLSPSLLWTNPRVSYTQSESGGFLDPMFGTFIVAAIAIGIAGPGGVGVAVWLSEYGRPAPLARVVESTVEMLAGAPSVVLALFGILLFGRVRYGWRGRSAVRWTLSGFGFLILAYFGAKFALEVVFGRHWG